MSEPGDRIAGRYLLTRRIASGGMGVVWQAEDEVLRRTVAVKQLRVGAAATEADAELAHQRAMREARITARLHHPHAVSIFDVVEHDGSPHIVMQYVPSESLSAVLRRAGALPVSDVARIGAQVAEALQAAHALGIVHRDVKPANILIAEPGGEALLTDFGISHAADDAALTSTGMLFGTPAYLAPEVARGEESTPAADVFSLGSTIYAAVEGRPPFGDEANGVAVLHRVAAASFAAPVRSGALRPVLLRMLRPDPAERPTMVQAATALTVVAAGVEEAEEPTALLVPEADDAADGAAAPTVREPAAATLLMPAADSSGARPEPTMLLPAPAPAPAEEPAKEPPPRRRRALLWLIGAAAVLVIAIAGFGLIRAASSGGTAPVPSTSSAKVVVRSSPPTSATPRPTASTPRATASTSTPTATAQAPAPTGPAAGGGGGGGGKGPGNGQGKGGPGNGKGGPGKPPKK